MDLNSHVGRSPDHLNSRLRKLCRVLADPGTRSRRTLAKLEEEKAAIEALVGRAPASYSRPLVHSQYA